MNNLIFFIQYLNIIVNNFLLYFYLLSNKFMSVSIFSILKNFLIEMEYRNKNIINTMISHIIAFALLILISSYVYLNVNKCP